MFSVMKTSAFAANEERFRSLEKEIYQAKSRDSKVVSYSDYYLEKSTKRRVNINWTVSPIENPQECLPEDLTNSEVLKKGAEKLVVKPSWEELIKDFDPFSGHTVGNEIANVESDVAIFPTNTCKPRAAEIEACNDCKAGSWTGFLLPSLVKVSFAAIESWMQALCDTCLRFYHRQ